MRFMKTKIPITFKHIITINLKSIMSKKIMKLKNDFNNLLYYFIVINYIYITYYVVLSVNYQDLLKYLSPQINTLVIILIINLNIYLYLFS